jgi:hypothetical protein
MEEIESARNKENGREKENEEMREERKNAYESG